MRRCYSNEHNSDEIADLTHQPFQYVSATQAAEFYAAARPRKHMATYEAGHNLHTAEVAADRVAWLSRELEIKK